MGYAFSGSQLQQLLKDMGQADLQVLAKELLPALEEVLNAVSPSSIQGAEVAIEALINPALQSALASLIAQVKL